MAPYTRWVHKSFKKVLLASCDVYLASKNWGPEKMRTKLIKTVLEEITQISEQTHEAIPDDLEKVSNMLDTLFKFNNCEYIQCV
jgi:hypothetical protein